MEIISKHVIENEVLDIRNEQIRDISEGVDILMNRFMLSMKADFREIQVDQLRLCGSMAEKTRIWNPKELEFDYLAILNSWPDCSELRFQHIEGCTGSMKITYNIHDSVSDKTEFLSNGVGHTFVYNYLASVEQRCKKNFCPQYAIAAGVGKRNWSENGCNFCTAYTDSGKLILGSTPRNYPSKLAFYWKPAVLSTECQEDFEKKDGCKRRLGLMRINVDFHPVIAIRANNVVCTRTDRAYRSLLSGQTPLYLFPKTCGQHSQRECSNMTWRISTHEVELDIITKTSLTHRHAYTILKYLITVCKTVNSGLVSARRRYRHYFKDVSSYHLKSILLQHIDECDNPSKGEKYCLTEMLEMLAACYKNKNLPHFLLPYNLFEVTSRSLGQFDCQVMGHVLKALADILNTPDAHLNFEDIIRDVIAIRFIICESERVEGLKHSSMSLHVSHEDTYNDCVKNINEETLRVLAHTLSEFISSRCKSSAEEWLLDVSVKYVNVDYRYTYLDDYDYGNRLQFDDMKTKQRKDNIDKRFCKIKIEHPNSNKCYFMNTMNESWLCTPYMTG